MKKYLFIILISFSGIAHAQDYLLNNEQLIFSFDTKSGKHVVLAKDKNNLYIVYRLYTGNKIEFEFPDKVKSSWSKFKYSFYLRGGGIQNEGMDMNYIYFINDSFKYTIYDTYYAVGNEFKVGIKVTNLKTNKTSDIKGVHRTIKGTLVDFRDNNLLEITDDSEN